MTEAHEIDVLTPTRLRAVIAVAATGSFSAAARQLGGSQPGISRAVAAVEAAIGATLFDRSTRSVRATEAGREFVEHARVVIAELDAAREAMAGEGPTSPRAVFAALTSVSEGHLAAVAAKRPGLDRFRCIEGLQATIVHAVSSGQAVAGICDLAHVGSDLATRPLWEEPFRLAAARDHRLRRRRTVDLADIGDDPLVAFSRDAELRTTVDRELASVRRLRSPDYVVDRFQTALSLVEAGLGVMVAPAIIAPVCPAGVTLLPLSADELRRTMGVIQPHDAALAVPVARLFDEIADHVVATVGDPVVRAVA